MEVTASRAAVISMRWLVVWGSAPLAYGPFSTAHAHPPGPGFPRQAPSVYAVVVTALILAEIGGCPRTSGLSATMEDMEPVIFDGFAHQLPDIDPGETGEWLDSFDAVVETHGKTRARFLLMKL